MDDTDVRTALQEEPGSSFLIHFLQSSGFEGRAPRVERPLLSPLSDPGIDHHLFFRRRAVAVGRPHVGASGGLSSKGGWALALLSPTKNHSTIFHNPPGNFARVK